MNDTVIDKKQLTKQKKQELKAEKRKILKHRLKTHWQLYLLLIPMVVYLFFFEYIPLYGVQMAFRNFKPYLGIWGSEWIGLENFKRFFTSNMFSTIVPNTLILSVYSLVAGLIPPIFLAIVLNYIPSTKYKKLVQNITYAPHFISLVVLVSMISVFFSTGNGLVNAVITKFGGEEIFFLGDPDTFRHLYVWSGVWKGVGWGSIIYLANLTNVSPELHEAARVDGATIWQRIKYIDIPTIMPTIVTLLILDIGGLMSVGFDKAFLMQNSFNLEASELISTYVYKRGLLNGQYSYSAAVGLFNSLINLILILSANKISKKVADTGIF